MPFQVLRSGAAGLNSRSSCGSSSSVQVGGGGGGGGGGGVTAARDVRVARCRPDYVFFSVNTKKISCYQMDTLVLQINQ